ncbi:MAG TPA: FAD-dependent thymidylate synthase [Caldisericia bacterium]|jgi:thymidylate synthase (FAD)|nr:FAD-dependent thymidylate synthase [Caldisericia bacterium]HXK51673.1 FAD-dependent thymidylate synthase [Caldisericia bacterium]
MKIQEVPLKVTLLNPPSSPLHIVALSARITRGLEESHYTDEEYFHLLYKLGHLSVMEHISFSFHIEGISRACSHQLVRFRIGVSFTQRSQRYTDESNLQIILPPTIEKNDSAHNQYIRMLEEIQQLYCNLMRLGIPKEDARFILPNAASTSLIMTMNFRELMHACHLRLCTKAQWEIQRLFHAIKKEIHAYSPFLSNYLQPKCVFQGHCTEMKPCKTSVQIQNDWHMLNNLVP